MQIMGQYIIMIMRFFVGVGVSAWGGLEWSLNDELIILYYIIHYNEFHDMIRFDVIEAHCYVSISVELVVGGGRVGDG